MAILAAGGIGGRTLTPIRLVSSSAESICNEHSTQPYTRANRGTGTFETLNLLICKQIYSNFAQLHILWHRSFHVRYWRKRFYSGPHLVRVHAVGDTLFICDLPKLTKLPEVHNLPLHFTGVKEQTNRRGTTAPSVDDHAWKTMMNTSTKKQLCHVQAKDQQTHWCWSNFHEVVVTVSKFNCLQHHIAMIHKSFFLETNCIKTYILANKLFYNFRLSIEIVTRNFEYLELDQRRFHRRLIGYWPPFTEYLKKLRNTPLNASRIKDEDKRTNNCCKLL